MNRRALALLAALLLAGCATLPSQLARLPDAGEAHAAQAAREALLAEEPNWRLIGRVAFANADDAATTNIDWTQRGSDFRIELTSPVLGRAWVIEGGTGFAVMDGMNGERRYSKDAELLLREATGWTLPIAELPDWVRGARGRGPVSALRVDAAGLPIGWQQAGWTLRFPDWLPGEPPLPRRIFAQSATASLRLSVARWERAP